VNFDVVAQRPATMVAASTTTAAGSATTAAVSPTSAAATTAATSGSHLPSSGSNVFPAVVAGLAIVGGLLLIVAGRLRST